MIDLWQLEITKHVRGATGVFLQLRNSLMRTGLAEMDCKATVGLEVLSEKGRGCKCNETNEKRC